MGYELDQGLCGLVINEPAHDPSNYNREYTLISEDWAVHDGSGHATTRRRRKGLRLGPGKGAQKQRPQGTH